MSLAGFQLIRTDLLDRLLQALPARGDLEFLSAMPRETVPKILDYLKYSKSQLRQDLFVLSHLNFRQKGYFVEFGAASGVELSNTYLLEKHFGWTGILSEPARTWKDSLLSNRQCIVDTSCIWSSSGEELEFSQARAPELSTLSSFKDADLHKRERSASTVYRVSTTSLTDLLARHSAPTVIDYLSIDTEGSEFEILEAFDFERYKFRVITCEHNFTQNREGIDRLLSLHGYQRVYREVSHFDDWFVNSELEELDG